MRPRPSPGGARRARRVLTSLVLSALGQPRPLQDALAREGRVLVGDPDQLRPVAERPPRRSALASATAQRLYPPTRLVGDRVLTAGEGAGVCGRSSARSASARSLAAWARWAVALISRLRCAAPRGRIGARRSARGAPPTRPDHIRNLGRKHGFLRRAGACISEHGGPLFVANVRPVATARGRTEHRRTAMRGEGLDLSSGWNWTPMSTVSGQPTISGSLVGDRPKSAGRAPRAVRDRRVDS